MSFNKLAIWVIVGIGIIIMMVYLLRLEEAFADVDSKEEVFQAIRNFQISIWISWLLITGGAIYLKWRNNENILFALDYSLVILGFICLGYYLDQGEKNGLLSPAESFREGFFYLIIKNIILISGMTAFIQAAIWWFSKKWHRR